MDPYAGMTERQRKLAELQARLRQSRKANQNAVIAERRREKACVSDQPIWEATCLRSAAAHLCRRGSSVQERFVGNRLRHAQGSWRSPGNLKVWDRFCQGQADRALYCFATFPGKQKTANLLLEFRLLKSEGNKTEES